MSCAAKRIGFDKWGRRHPMAIDGDDPARLIPFDPKHFLVRRGAPQCSFFHPCSCSPS
jgi:hypothetical protein